MVHVFRIGAKPNENFVVQEIEYAPRKRGTDQTYTRRIRSDAG
jgi:hypothetical protein